MRVSRLTAVIYHSPLTTLTILRIARPHYRLLWSAITLLTTLNGQQVIPRVIVVSGTIKKLQNAAIAYHRNVTAGVLAVALDSKGESMWSSGRETRLLYEHRSDPQRRGARKRTRRNGSIRSGRVNVLKSLHWRTELSHPLLIHLPTRSSTPIPLSTAPAWPDPILTRPPR